MKNVDTDRPKCIKVLYVYDNPIALDTPSGYGDRMIFTVEVIDTFGEDLWLFAAFRNDNNHKFAKEHYVPLFS